MVNFNDLTKNIYLIPFITILLFMLFVILLYIFVKNLTTFQIHITRHEFLKNLIGFICILTILFIIYIIDNENNTNLYNILLRLIILGLIFSFILAPNGIYNRLFNSYKYLKDSVIVIIVIFISITLYYFLKYIIISKKY